MLCSERIILVNRLIHNYATEQTVSSSPDAKLKSVNVQENSRYRDVPEKHVSFSATARHEMLVSKLADILIGSAIVRQQWEASTSVN